MRRPTLALHAAQMRAGMVSACKRALEEQLKAPEGKSFLAEWIALRLYLMLGRVDGGVAHLDVDWATERFTALWASALKKSGSASSEQELAKLARPHVEHYFRKVKQRRIAPIALDEEVIQRARVRLEDHAIDERYYDLLVLWIAEEGNSIASNLVFPPIELPNAFPQRTNEVLRHVRSKSYLAGTHYRQVPGPYTRRGYVAVLAQLESVQGLLRAESWVFQFPEEAGRDELAKITKRVRERYETEYIDAWMAFFADIEVRAPSSSSEAEEIYRELSANPTPLQKLLGLLEDNTQWKDADPREGVSPPIREAHRRFLARIEGYERLVKPSPEFIELGERSDRIPGAFRSTVAFGKAPSDEVGSKAYQYGELHVKLRDLVIRERNRRSDDFLGHLKGDIDATHSRAEALVTNDCDEVCHTLLEPILLAPLTLRERPTIGAPSTSTTARLSADGEAAAEQ